jgi:hypothetical protein
MDRRTYSRVLPSRIAPAIVTHMDGFREVGEIDVRNVSENGVCLSFSMNPSALYMRDNLSFELDLGPAGLLTLRGFPRYVHRCIDGRYDLGLELLFLDEASQAALIRYVDARQRDDSRHIS